MHLPTSLENYVWQSTETALCTLDISATALSERLEISLVQWDEPGLGSASGLCCKLACGLVVLLEELAHAREHQHAKGATLYVEANELVEQGVDATLTRVLAGLHLTRTCVVWTKPP